MKDWLKSEKIGKNGMLKKIAKTLPELYEFEGDLYIRGQFYKKIKFKAENKQDFIRKITQQYQDSLGVRWSEWMGSKQKG